MCEPISLAILGSAVLGTVSKKQSDILAQKRLDKQIAMQEDQEAYAIKQQEAQQKNIGKNKDYAKLEIGKRKPSRRNPNKGLGSSLSSKRNSSLNTGMMKNNPY